MRRTLLLTLFALSAAACGRPATEAGVKFAGVGMDPGTVQQPGEPKGGIIDLVQVQIAGRNLDLGVTGFFRSTGAFTDPEDEPFNSVLAFSYLFTPKLQTAATAELISPVGPSVIDTCMVVANNNGPLGSFDTVDVGEFMRLSIDRDEELPRCDDRTRDLSEPCDNGMEMAMARTPQDYLRGRSVNFAYYSGFGRLLQNHAVLPDNWRFGETARLHFDGGVPPDDAPIASIPRPSDAPDARVGKGRGDPQVWLPERLTGIRTFPRSGRGSGAEGRDVVYDPEVAGVPGPFSSDSDGSMRIVWDAPELSSETTVTVALRLLRKDEAIDEPFLNPLDPRETASCNDSADVSPANYEGGINNRAWYRDHVDMKSWWCDPGYEPDPEVRALYGGRAYPTRECVDGTCRDLGGDRDPAGSLATLICNVEDKGAWNIQKEDVDLLLSSVDTNKIGGAVLVMSRTWEDDQVNLPAVRDNLGMLQDINPIRVRAAHMVIGRLEYSGE